MFGGGERDGLLVFWLQRPRTSEVMDGPGKDPRLTLVSMSPYGTSLHMIVWGRLFILEHTLRRSSRGRLSLTTDKVEMVVMAATVRGGAEGHTPGETFEPRELGCLGDDA